MLKNKESILASYESNASTSKQGRTSKFSDVNEALYQWYCLACSKNICPSGPQLVEKAKGRLGKSEFIGTNGWLSKWKKRYNVRKSPYVVNQGMSLVRLLPCGRRDSRRF